MNDLRRRISALEKAQEPNGRPVVAAFGDDPIPDGLPPNTVAVRFDEQDRHL